MNNWLACKMFIHIFTIVKRVRHTANYWREVWGWPRYTRFTPKIHLSCQWRTFL